MLQEKKSKRGAWIALGCVAALLVLVIVLENTMQPTSMLFTVLKKGAVYALVAASLNLLNGFTGLFSLGQAGFMLLGAYTYAILTIPSADRESVYYLYGGSAVNFSLPELFVGGALGLILGVLAALILAGCVAAVIAWLIGLPVLRLKSDYLAIATLGFAEIIRAIFQWDRLGPVTNGANALKSFPTFSSFNIENANGEVVLRLSTFVPFLLVAVCIGIMVLLINSTYGRAFKAIREDEVAAEAMGINLAKHKRMAFCISSFFAGVGGGLFAMFANQAQAKTFTTSMTYEILLIVVIGGIGSISGSCIASFLYVAASEWWLRFLDTETYIGAFKVPFLRTGFRMVVFSIIIMIVVLFFRRGLMGDRELSDVARSLRAALRKIEKEGGGEMSEKILRLENITMQFGGVIAVNNMNLEVGEGEIVSLIGPNGAGKTTAFNVITGVYQPTNGAVWYRGRRSWKTTPRARCASSTRASTPGVHHALAPTPDKIARMGMARTFQNIRLWKDQTVFDNVLTAMHCRATQSPHRHLPSEPAGGGAAAPAGGRALLAEVNLSDVSGEKANSLPYGKQRRLEIAQALATDHSCCCWTNPLRA